MSLQLLRDLQGNMTFFQFFKKIFDLTSIVVFPFALDVDASKVADAPSRMFNILNASMFLVIEIPLNGCI